MVIAKEPFRFYTSSTLVELTGKKAATLEEFRDILKEIDESSVFCHTHQAFREYDFAKGTYTNDFAYWAKEALREDPLSERLASIDIREYINLKDLKEAILNEVEEYIAERGGELGRVPRGKEFHFCEATTVSMPTEYEVRTLEEFAKALKKIGGRSLFYHFFEARLRLGRATNDFSYWILDNLGEKELAEQIDRIDPYMYTSDGLREKILELIEEEIKLTPFLELIGDSTRTRFTKFQGMADMFREHPLRENIKLLKAAYDRFKKKIKGKKK